MSINARMSPQDPRLYNVNRDLAHNFEFIINNVALCIEQGRWGALTRLAREHGVTDAELGKACSILCVFVAVQADNPKESMAACLARCGFLDLNEISRVIVMAYLGNIVLGIHHNGVREATLGGVGPAQTYKQLAQAGANLTLIMDMPRWKRRWYKFKQRAQRAWTAFNSVSIYDGEWHGKDNATSSGVSGPGTQSGPSDQRDQQGNDPSTGVGP